MNELVVITGSSSGIGLATARRFAQQGHALLLLSRRGDVSGDALPNAIYQKVDVLDRDAMEKAISEAEEKFGPVGCLVNNAGVMLLGNYGEQAADEWEQMIDINVKGVLNGIRAVLPGMRERKRGTIINVSSVAGRKVFPNGGVYSATKFAVHALTEALRMEVASDDIRCVTISPGIVETELLDHTTDKRLVAGLQQLKRQVGRTLDAQDIADVIAYAYGVPPHVCIREIIVAPTGQME
jgi:NADP-dependent 3-hydroxy acid dehydrogenase YdfG